jgi:hypothetical protein
MEYEHIHGTNAGASSPGMAASTALDAANAFLNQLAFYIGKDAPDLREGNVRRLIAIRALWILCRALKPYKGSVEGYELFAVSDRLWVFQDLTLNRGGCLQEKSANSQWRKVDLPFEVTRKPMQLVLQRYRRIDTLSPIETVVNHANEYLLRDGTCSINGRSDLPENPPSIF